MILAVLQARVSSSRLPGKVLLPLEGEAMLAQQIARVRQSKRLDDFIVATSTQSDDDPLAELCVRIGVRCYRGSIDDVLDRFYQAALLTKPDHVVRLTGDCPLFDPEMLDKLVDYYLENCFDYASNCFEPTLPDGLDAEIFSFTALARAHREARLPSEREHVTPFINKQPKIFRAGCWRSDVDLSALRWTVDEPADYELVKRIYARLFPANPRFRTADVLALLESEPEWKTANTMHKRNEGFQKSLEQDRTIS